MIEFVEEAQKNNVVISETIWDRIFEQLGADSCDSLVKLPPPPPRRRPPPLLPPPSRDFYRQVQLPQCRPRMVNLLSRVTSPLTISFSTPLALSILGRLSSCAGTTVGLSRRISIKCAYHDRRTYRMI